MKNLENKKVYVNGKSKEIQEKLFKLGFYWKTGGSKEIQHTNSPFLYLYENHKIFHGSNMDDFAKYPFKEISVEEILSTKYFLYPQEFRIGDVATLEASDRSFYVFIYKSKVNNDFISHFACLCPFGNVVFESQVRVRAEDKIRLASEEERRVFYYELERCGQRWNPSTETLDSIDLFKPFEEVLVRNSEDAPWDVSLYVKYNKEEKIHETFHGAFRFCIYYKGNEDEFNH